MPITARSAFGTFGPGRGAARRDRRAWPPSGPKTPWPACDLCCDRPRSSIERRGCRRRRPGFATASRKASAGWWRSTIWCAGTTWAATSSSPTATAPSCRLRDHPLPRRRRAVAVRPGRPRHSRCTRVGPGGRAQPLRGGPGLPASRDPRTAGGQLVQPAALWWFVADVERTVSWRGRLVGSAPRSEGAVGLVVSARSGHRDRRRARPCAAGPPPASAKSPPSASCPSLGWPLSPGRRRRRSPWLPSGTARSGHQLGDRHRVPGRRMAWHAGALWAAGPDGGDAVDDYDWERLSGGGFAALDPPTAS